jgi:hypothetical protein
MSLSRRHSGAASRISIQETIYDVNVIYTHVYTKAAAVRSFGAEREQSQRERKAVGDTRIASNEMSNIKA